MARLKRIVSGGQTGVDQAAWEAARAAGLATAGWMPKGFLTSDGPRPEFAALYGARETGTEDYAFRTGLNVKDSDATLWLGDLSSRGGRATRRAAMSAHRPFTAVLPDDLRESSASRAAELDRLRRWAEEGRYVALNVAGNREWKAPGIGRLARAFLGDLFAAILAEPASCPATVVFDFTGAAPPGH